VDKIASPSPHLEQVDVFKLFSSSVYACLTGRTYGGSAGKAQGTANDKTYQRGGNSYDDSR
jgi:hypothetical protein